MSENKKILEVKNLTTEFQTEYGKVKAIQNVSFDVFQGKSLGLVGESGSGKSVTALSIMRLIQSGSGKVTEGEIFLEGKNILSLSEKEMRSIRGNKISMIFQEPMTSLNPVFTIGNQIEEVIVLHQKLKLKEAKERGIELLQLVGIPAPEKRINEYPHQLSGGMRQRVMIAMALACNPKILIADEPTTALDVTIQAQILELMQKLQQEMGMGIILITHDLGVVAEMCDEVAVMYCGRIVEKTHVKNLFGRPFHPYSQGLIESIPHFESTNRNEMDRLFTIPGVVPSLSKIPPGCSFQDRCRYAGADCRGPKGVPKLEAIEPLHQAACFFPLNHSTPS